MWERATDEILEKLVGVSPEGLTFVGQRRHIGKLVGMRGRLQLPDHIPSCWGVAAWSHCDHGVGCVKGLLGGNESAIHDQLSSFAAPLL